MANADTKQSRASLDRENLHNWFWNQLEAQGAGAGHPRRVVFLVVGLASPITSRYRSCAWIPSCRRSSVENRYPWPRTRCPT